MSSSLPNFDRLSAEDGAPHLEAPAPRPLRRAEVAPERPLERAIASGRDALTKLQSPDGHWMFELEADCTIPAEYIIMMHFLGEIDAQLEQKLARYLRAHQGPDDGWPLYENGPMDLSCTVKVYWALKLVGDDPQAEHMVRARAAILTRGGAARCNVFTRITLALFGEIPWRGVPYIPVEIMLLPRWFIFHLDKVAYWSRTVMVPLFILVTKKPKARNPRNIDIRELFVTPPDKERHYFRRTGVRNSLLARLFLLADRFGRLIDPHVSQETREEATRKAEAWVLERLNGEGGLGAIFPAMVNALEVMAILGYPADDPRRVTAKRALEKLLVVTDDSVYCQPCVSPVWDTALAALTLQEVGDSSSLAASGRALAWLKSRQLLDEPGDWQVARPDLPGGGWPFQFENGHYPDLDDTAVAAWAMHQAKDATRYRYNIDRALNWLVGMQSSNGGFAAFEVDNTHYHLNEIPFADHGALLDPPTSDVTARVVKVLARVGRPEDHEALQRALSFLRKEQEHDGSWFGRWGTNYIYGTWSVLTALGQAGLAEDPAAQRAVAWLLRRQNPDGGWGETNDSYGRRAGAETHAPSTPYQTAWALLGLMAVGEGGTQVVQQGVEYLLKTQQPDGLWSDPTFTAPGFPRVFYLKYHGYCAYFPLWALAAYRKISRTGHGH